MTRTTTLLTGALFAGALALTGCSDDSVASHMDASESGSSGSTSTSATEDAAFDDADVAFAQGMIPHHQQAIEMAQLAQDRATDPRVLDLAGRIEGAQQPEIETLSGWLEEWGADDSGTGGPGHGSTDHGSTDHGGGLMSEEDMSALTAASGAEFDRLFLEQMIEHHAGAVEMAITESTQGQHPGAVAMAEAIRDTQNAEIAEMRQLLDELGG